LNLSFLAPVAFLGLLALAVPIYLHLRHKPRAEVYKFPAIDFLLRAQKKKKRRFHAEQLLLMLFRIGIICLLAFLFAKPFIDEAFSNGALTDNQPVIILLDDSVSMLAGPRPSPFFSEAVARIEELLQGRSSVSQASLLLASNPTANLEQKTGAEIRGLLATLRPTTRRVTLDAAYAEALDLIEREGWSRATVRIFSDGSLSAWREMPARKPDKADVIYTSLRDGQPDFFNLGITAVRQPPGDANAVEVAVLSSDARARDFEVTLSGGGDGGLSQLMRIEPFGHVTHFFGLGDNLPATLNAAIPDDDFAYDNAVVFAPRPNRNIRVLIVDGDTHPDAVRSESFFFKNALGLDESEKYGFAYEVVTPVGLTTEKIAAADVICLLNVDVPMVDALRASQAAGKGLFISMGDRIEFERWNTYLSDFDLEVYEVKSLRSPVPVELKTPGHDLFQPIDEYEWRAYLGEVGISKHRIVSVGRTNIETPLTTPDGSPLLLVRDINPGRLAIWTTSIDIDWTNFPLEMGFVPFLRQLTSWLAGKESATSFQSHTVDEVLELGLVDSLNLKYANPAFADLAVAGPVPGIYSRKVGNNVQFVQVTLDPRELDFKSFDSLSSGENKVSALEELGFRSYLRSDLAPSIQWLLFVLILVETAVAARLTLNWGAK